MAYPSATTLLAIWGAVVATITFGWNLFRDLTKKGRLRVNCWIGKIVTVGEESDPNDYLVYVITNIGNEPVVLTHIGGKNNDGKNFMIIPHIQLPKTLKSGEYITEYSQKLDILDDDLLKLWAIDSLDRYFKVPRKRVKKLKKEYKSIIEKGAAD